MQGRRHPCYFLPALYTAAKLYTLTNEMLSFQVVQFGYWGEALVSDHIGITLVLLWPERLNALNAARFSCCCSLFPFGRLRRPAGAGDYVLYGGHPAQ